MNDLPTVFEVVTDRKPAKEKPSVDSGSRSQGSAKVYLVDHVFFDNSQWNFLCTILSWGSV